MLNRIILMGRLTRDPELRQTQSGASVANFSLAVDRDFKDKQTGEKTTDFIDIVAWRSSAEFVSRFFTKGRMAVVEGRLQLRDWTDMRDNPSTFLVSHQMADGVKNAERRIAALNLALSALRPVSREQVERVRGEWINTNKEVEQMCKCSKCGYPISYFWSRTPFCPNCGAPMTDEAVDMVLKR